MRGGNLNVCAELFPCQRTSPQHKFVWIKHPLPLEAHRRLEKERGITGPLRSPAFHLGSRQYYDPLLVLEALIRSAKRYQPA